MQQEHHREHYKFTINSLFLKVKITILLLIFSINSFAATYYISSSYTGSNGTSNGSQSRPYISWAHLPTIVAGDFILFKRGESFLGTLPIQSGSKGNPITYGAYDTGDLPIITGLTQVTAWNTKDANGIVESTNAVSALNTLQMVTINDLNTPKARFPKRKTSNKGWRNFTSRTTTSLTDNTISGKPNFTGGEIVVRVRHDIIDRRVIDNHAGSMFTWATSLSGVHDNRIGFGYFLQNHYEALKASGTAVGEWAYTSTNKLQVYVGAGNISSLTVRAASVDRLIDAGGKSFITIQDIHFSGSNDRMVKLTTSNNITFQNCRFNNSGGTAMYFGDSHTISILNNEFNNNNQFGINGEYGCRRFMVKNNTFTNTAQYEGMIHGGYGGNAIYVTDLFSGSHTATSLADTTIIEGNNIIRAGAGGIRISGSYIKAIKNFVYDFSFVKDDVGGIYCADQGTVSTNREISNNIIDYSLGAFEGTPDAADTDWNAGLYFDDESNFVIANNNTVSRVKGIGFFIQRSNNVSASGNTIYDCDRIFRLQYVPLHTSNPETVHSITLNNNIFFSRLASQNTAYFSTRLEQSDIRNFGTLTNNVYARPISGLDPEHIITHTKIWVTGSDQRTRSLNKVTGSIKTEGWNQFSLQDLNSINSPNTIYSDNQLYFNYNNTYSLESFILPSGTWTDVRGNSFLGIILLQPFTSAVLIRTSVEGAPPSNIYYIKKFNKRN